MLKQAGVFVSLSTLGLAMFGDYKVTLSNISTIIILRGLAFLAQNVIDSFGKDTKNLINFTSYSLCAVSFINILKAAQSVFSSVIGAIV